MNNKVQLRWTDSDLYVVNSFALLEEKVLSYSHKSLVHDGKGYAKTEFERRRMYNVLTPAEPRVVYTMQGFLDKVKAFCEKQGYEVTVQDDRLSYDEPDLSKTHGFRLSQKYLFEEAITKERSGILEAPTRYGKCLSPDTQVLMYNGTCKRADEIEIGDRIMGPDSKPRTVSSLGWGTDEMYHIIPNKGDSWKCNGEHILSLMSIGGAKFGGYNKGGIVHLTVNEYLAKSDYFKHSFKQYQVPVNFPSQPVPYDPYIVGAWLGDGAKDSNSLTKSNKPELTSYLHMTSDERRVPHVYLYNDKQTRLRVLAGLLDTDGSRNNKGVEITTKHPGLRDDILYLARSLGFRATWEVKIGRIESLNFSGTYYRVHLHGNFREVPFVIKSKWNWDNLQNTVNPLMTGFKVEALGTGRYCGFELVEEDKRFVLGNFTVTHNTTLIINAMRAFPNVRTVVAAPGVDLLQQLHATLKESIIGREIKALHSGSKHKLPSDDITLCSFDSLHKCDKEGTRLLLIDEPHEAVTRKRAPMLYGFTHARKIGFGATPSGRYDQSDDLITGLIGPTLAKKTFKDAVREGSICPIHVILFKQEVPAIDIKGPNARNNTYKRLLWQNGDMASLIYRIAGQIIPDDFQTIFFVNNELQAKFLHKYMPNTEIAMAKLLSAKERKEVFRKMQEGEILRCISSDIYRAGVTFSDLRCIVNAAGGGGSISCIQKPGRLAEIRPGKSCGVLFDFLFSLNEDPGMMQKQEGSWKRVVSDSISRKRTYKSKGYEIHEVSTIDDAIKIFNEVTAPR